jgi:hypothetical protein
MRTRRFSVALAALSIPLLAGSAFAVANSVSTTPGPQVIIPSRTSSNTPTTARHANRGPGNANSVGTTSTTADDNGHDGPGHDANDDRGHDGTTVTTTPDDRGDDGPGHDANDDRGHDGTTPTTVTTTPDDHGHDGPGHDGGDDGSGHDGGDDNSGPGSGSSGPGH